MSIQDVLKKSFLKSFGDTNSTTSIAIMVTALALALIFGLLICLAYNKFYRGVVYNRSFAITIVGMSVMTAMVTLAISTNVVISLGMVGALSIVRYRTAVKEPLDLLYLFWAITTGITCGAQMYVLAVIAGIIMFLLLLFFNARSRTGHLYIVVIHYNGDTSADMIRRAMNGVKYRIKSTASRGDNTELAIEVYVSNSNLAFVEKLRSTDGVIDVSTVQYNGEYHG
mgnify:FL=1